MIAPMQSLWEFQLILSLLLFICAVSTQCLGVRHSGAVTDLGKGLKCIISPETQKDELYGKIKLTVLNGNLHLLQFYDEVSIVNFIIQCHSLL